jgi:hypothetical protein
MAGDPLHSAAYRAAFFSCKSHAISCVKFILTDLSAEYYRGRSRVEDNHVRIHNGLGLMTRKQATCNGFSGGQIDGQLEKSW